MDYITYAFLTSQLWEWVTFLRTSSQASCGNGLYYVENLNKRGKGMDYITEDNLQARFGMDYIT